MRASAPRCRVRRTSEARRRPVLPRPPGSRPGCSPESPCTSDRILSSEPSSAVKTLRVCAPGARERPLGNSEPFHAQGHFTLSFQAEFGRVGRISRRRNPTWGAPRPCFMSDYATLILRSDGASKFLLASQHEMALLSCRRVPGPTMSARHACRPAGNQPRGGKAHVAGRCVGVLDTRDQHVHGFRDHRGRLLPDRGEIVGGPGGGRNVVESDDRDVVGNAQPELGSAARPWSRTPCGHWRRTPRRGAPRPRTSAAPPPAPG